MFWFYFWIIVLLITGISAVVLFLGPAKIHDSVVFATIIIIFFYISRVGIFITDPTVYLLPYFLNWILGLPVFILSMIVSILAEVQIKFKSFSGAAEDKTLITTGIYGRIRHPIYFTEIFWPVGLVMIMGKIFSLFIVIGCAIYFICVHIPLEERDLIKVHGEEYINYKKQVPMIFPINIRNRKK